jgi:transcriptional regulator with XRE-family HTH domain
MGRQKGKKAYASAFGKALDEQLTRRSMRQTELAQATGVSPSYVNRLMTVGNPSPQWVEIIAITLQLGPSERVDLHTAAAIDAGYKLDLTKKNEPT